MDYDGGTVVATAVLDRKPLQEGFVAARREAERFEANDIEIDIILNYDRNDEFERMFAEFERAHDVEIDVDIDKDRKGETHLLSLIGLLGKLAAATAAAGIASNALTVAVGGLGAVAGTLAQAGGAVLLVPAAIGAVVLSINALKAATTGFGDALKAMDDPAKFAEAIKDLSPSAREAARAIHDLKPAVDAINLSAQERLFKGLGKEIHHVATQVLPILGEAYNRIASYANGAVRSTLEVITSSSRLRDLQAIGDNSAYAFGNLSGVLDSMVSIFIDLTAVGSKWLGELTEGAGGLAAHFAEVVHQMRESGRLDEIISNALSVLGQLAGILGNIFRIIGAVFEAGAETGGSFLSVLESITGQIAEFAHSIEGQEALKSFFGGIADLAKGVMPVIGGLVQAIAAIAPAIGQAGEIAGPILGDILNQVALALSAIGPGLVDLVSGFGALLRAIAPLLPILAAVLAPILSTIGGILEAVAPAVGDFATVLGGVLLEVMRALLPVLPKIVGAFSAMATLISESLSDSAPALITIAEALGTFLAEAIEAVLPLLPQLVDLGLQFLEALLPLLPPLIQLATELLPLVVIALEGLIEVLGIIVPAFARITPVIADFFSFLAEIAVPGVQILGEVFKATFHVIEAVVRSAMTIIEGLINLGIGLITRDWGQAWDGIKQIVSGAVSLVIGTIRAMVDNVINLFGGPLRAIGTSMGHAWRSVIDAVVSGSFQVIGFVATLPIRMLNALGNTGTFLYDAGRNLIQGLINGLLSKLTSVASAAANVVHTIRDHFPFSPAKVGPFSGGGAPVYSGISIAEQVAEGMRSRNEVVRREADALARIISKALTVEAHTALAQSIEQTVLAGVAGSDDSESIREQVAGGVRDALDDGVAVSVDRYGVGEMTTTRDLEKGRL